MNTVNIIKGLDDFIGRRVVINAIDDDYEGVIENMNFVSGTISLTSASSLNTKGECKTLHFTRDDIKNMKLLDSSPPITKEKKTKINAIKDNKVISTPSIVTDSDLSQSILLPPCAPLLPTAIDFNEATKFYSSSKKRNKLPCCSVVIDSFDENFNKAIELICDEDLIGVAMEGINIGRSGHLCWIQISTQQYVILFDFISLGPECFKCGLKEIFENKLIQKVIHDCRKISDMMANVFHVNMVNVFDTQVANVFIDKNYNNSFPRYVKSLHSCLCEILELLPIPEQVYIPRVREHAQQEDMLMWAQRPAKSEILDAAVKNVVYLLELRRVMLDNLLDDFRAGVDIYLKVVRDAREIEIKQMESHILPEAFRKLNLGSMKDREFRRRHHDHYNLRENIVRSVDPAVKSSHHGIRTVQENVLGRVLSQGSNNPSRTIEEPSAASSVNNSSFRAVAKESVNTTQESSLSAVETCVSIANRGSSGNLSIAKPTSNAVKNSDSEGHPKGNHEGKKTEICSTVPGIDNSFSDDASDGKMRKSSDNELKYMFKASGSEGFSGISKKMRKKLDAYYQQNADLLDESAVMNESAKEFSEFSNSEQDNKETCYNTRLTSVKCSNTSNNTQLALVNRSDTINNDSSYCSNSNSPPVNKRENFCAGSRSNAGQLVVGQGRGRGSILKDVLVTPGSPGTTLDAFSPPVSTTLCLKSSLPLVNPSLVLSSNETLTDINSHSRKSSCSSEGTTISPRVNVSRGKLLDHLVQLSTPPRPGQCNN